MTDGPASSPAPPLHPFTAPERELIRRELGMHFGQLPTVANGLFLRTWRGGPQAGQPKLPPAVRTMLERGLVEVRLDRRWARAHFTEAGLAALRELAQNKRLFDSVRYAHVRQELGLEPEADGAAPGGDEEPAVARSGTAAG